MQNNDKKYFIPVDGTPIEVSEEIYRAYYQPIWNTRYHAQKNGECRCTKAQLWKVPSRFMRKLVCRLRLNEVSRQ